MLVIYTWSVFITGIFFTSFGLFVYLRSPKDLTAKLFGLLSLAFAVWSYSWYFLLADTTSETNAIIFSKLLTFGSTFIPIFYLHWSLTVAGVGMKRKGLIVLGYIITFIFAAISFTDFYISGVRSVLFFTYWPIAGPAYTLFIIIGYLGLVLYGVYELIRAYPRAVGDNRYQIGYLLVGTLLGFGGGLTNFPLMYGFTFMQPFGLFATMASPFILSYAATQYKLMNIRVVASQFFLGALNIVFIINIIIAENIQVRFFNILLFVIVLYFSIVVIRGIRNEIKHLQQIEIQKADLKTANENQTNLIHIMNHQIKGKLGDARNVFAELLTTDYGVVPDTARSIIEKGLEATEAGVDYVQSVLKGYSAENGTLDYKMKDMDLKAMIKSISDKKKEKAEKKGLTFEVNLADGEFMVHGDEMQLGEALGNLINNAIAFTPSGSIHIWLTRKGNNALVAVQDTGVGISEEDKPRLWKSGGHGKDSIKVNVESTGYGLSFVKGVVEKHGGRTWGESDGPGKGSSFFMELPILGRV